MLTDTQEYLNNTGVAKAKAYGLDTSKINQIKVELDMLKRQGLLLDISVTGIGLFTRKAEFAESGITENDERVKRYTPGSKYLIPKETVERLRSIEVRMRECLNKYSFGDIDGFRPYRWLPWTSYTAFKNRWEELLDEFQALKTEILDSYDSYRDEIADTFQKAASQAWTSIVGQGYTAIIYKDKGYWDRYEFTDAVVEDALNMFPSYEMIQEKLQADYRVALVSSDDYVYERSIAEDLKEKAHFEKQAAKDKAQAAYLEQSLAQEKFDHVKRMNQLEQTQKELKIDAMMRAEIEHAKNQLATIKSPFEEVFTALRSQIAADCQNLLESIQKNKFVRGKIAEKARGLVDLYDLLAVHEDDDLRAKLVELRAAIGAVGDERTKEMPERDVTAVKATLEQIIELSHKAAQDLEDCRASFLELD